MARIVGRFACVCMRFLLNTSGSRATQAVPSSPRMYMPAARSETLCILLKTRRSGEGLGPTGFLRPSVRVVGAPSRLVEVRMTFSSRYLT